MLDKLDAVWRSTRHAVALIADRTASVDPRWLAAGVGLYFLSQTVRTRGWFTILRAAYPDASTLRARDVALAYLTGAGLNALIPARGGDLVKLSMVRRRIPGARYPTLAATFVPETLFETFVGIALVGWALAMGFLPVPTSTGSLPEVDVSLVVAHPFATTAALGALAAGILWLARRVGRQVRQGLAILHTPRLFITGVASWQALARLIRLGSFAAFMAAFALPVTPSTVVLVMAAQGAGRIIPLAPASAGLRLAMLSYGFVEVTGHAVDIAAITAFTFGVGALLAATGLVIAATIAGAEFGTLHPRRMLTVARARAAETPV
jgi:lysylphosphatidylglycerol synthase-like protein